MPAEVTKGCRRQGRGRGDEDENEDFSYVNDSKGSQELGTGSVCASKDTPATLKYVKLANFLLVWPKVSSTVG